MRNLLPKPAHIFQIGPSGYASPQYIDVVIHATDKDLNIWRKKKDPKAYDVNAFFRPAIPKPRDIHYCGEIHLSNDELDIPVIVHEVFHATASWARRNQCFPGKKAGGGWDFEEVCAESMEEMVNQILKELAHRGYVARVTRKS